MFPYRPKACDSIAELVGNTPMVLLKNIGKELAGVQLLAKLEYFNPGGSVKDRPALEIVLEAQRYIVPAEVRDAGMGGAAEHIYFSDFTAASVARAGPAVFGKPGALGAGGAARHADTALVDDGRRATLGGVFSGISDY